MKFKELLLLWWRRRRLARWRRRSRRTGGPPRRMRPGTALPGVPSPLARAGRLPDEGPVSTLQPVTSLPAASRLRLLAGGDSSGFRDPDPTARIAPQLSRSHAHVVEHRQGREYRHPQPRVITEGNIAVQKDYVLRDERLSGYPPHHHL